MQPERWPDDNGVWQIVNASEREVMIQYAEDNEIPVLGDSFLRAAVLSVNHDDNELTLWSATPTTDTDVQPIVKTGDTCNKSSNSTQNLSNNDSNNNNGRSLSTGAIVGIVIGIVVLLALLAVLAFFLIRKRRSSRGAYARPKETEPPIETSYTPYRKGPAELEHFGATKHEMAPMSPDQELKIAQGTLKHELPTAPENQSPQVYEIADSRIG